VNETGRRVLGSLLATAAMSFFGGCASEAPPAAFTVRPERGDFTVDVRARGHLEPAAEMVAAVPPQLFGSLDAIVDEGTSVVPGDVLFRVSTQRIERAARQFRLQAGRQRIAYEKVVEQNLQESAERTEELTGTQMTLTTARAKEALIRRGAEPLEVEKARLELAEATRTIEWASRRLQTRRSLADRGYASRLDLLQTEEQFDLAILKKTKAETTLVRLRRGKTALERDQAQRTTSRRQVAVDEVLDRNRRQARIDGLTEERERLEVESTEAAAQQREELMQRATVTATTTGTVIYLDLQNMGLGRPRMGMSVWQGMRLLKVADLSRLRAVVAVAARDVERVVEGQSARVEFPALPGVVCRGRVSRVGRIAMENGMEGDSAQAKRFEVCVELVEGHPRLRPNLTAVAVIGGARVADGLRVPAETVRFAEGGATMLVVRSHRHERVAVEVTAQDDDWCYLQGVADDVDVVLAGGGVP